MAIASLVLGLIAIAMSFTGPLGWIGLVIAILGIIFGIQGKKNDPKNAGLAKAGIVTSIIALVWDAVIFVACVLCAGALAAAGVAGSL